MIKLAISGASGRMGQALIRQIQGLEDLTVIAAIEHKHSSSIGEDAGLLAGVGELGVRISDQFENEEFDVLIEFTTIEATMEHLDTCRQLGKAILIGTTGLSAEDKKRIVDAGREIPVVLAANTSVGVNLCAALLETASKVIGDVTDIEVIEAHHRHKVDAPSGTALFFGEAVARPLGKELSRDGVFCREGQTGPRPKGSIGFSTIRGGDIAGEHTVMFIGDSERIEITHRATDRKIFAAGALRAASWLAGRPAGAYDMVDVLGLQ